MVEEPLALAIAEMCDCAHHYGMTWAAIHEAVIGAIILNLQLVDCYADHSDCADLLTWIACAQEGSLDETDRAAARAAFERIFDA